MPVVDAIELGDLHAEVVRKAIKHVYLCVYPPDGRVKISAPLHMALDTIRVYAITKLGWIHSQQRKLRAQERETPREYLDRESHWVWGQRRLLKIVEVDVAPSVKLTPRRLELHIRSGSDTAKRNEMLESWYRDQIRSAVPALLEKWRRRMGVQVGRIQVQRMKTRWGSCNTVTGLIRLNTDLARKPPECLEYIVVHELAHLIEPSHNARFQATMDAHLPNWRQLKNALNRLPVRHEDWDY